MSRSSRHSPQESVLRQRVRELAARDRPTAQDVDYLVDHATELNRAGLAGQAHGVLQGWMDAGHDDPDIRMAQIMLTASVPSSSAAHRRQAYETTDPAAAALEIVHCAFRGELQRAIEIAERHRWFTEAPKEIEGLSYAMLGLALQGRFEQAESIVDEWKSRHAAEIPSCYQMLLRFEAIIAAYRHQYARELSLIEQACALCEEQGHTATFEFTEPHLALALARNGDVDRARTIMQRWRRAPGTGPLNGMRDGARLEVGLLAGEYDAAYRAGLAALQTPPARLAPVHLRWRFALVLAAPANRFAMELAELERVVHRYPIQHFADRLRWLLHVLPTRETPARNVKLRLVSPAASADVGLVHLWNPPSECMQADLYWDGIRGIAMLRGRGPFSLERYPVLARMMTSLIDAPGFNQDVPTLFEATWGQPYDPLRHEGKVHVTVHRLRSWLSARGHVGAPLFTMRDGRLGLNPGAHVCALTCALADPPRAEARTSVEKRLCSFLCEHGPQPPRELALRLSISRTRLTQLLRPLVESGVVHRQGRGRAVQYAMAPVAPRGPPRE